MKVLMVLTYYRPYISGLTISAERLARSLCTRGHNVTILTSRYDKTLAQEETINGVRIIRAPVAFRASKGVVMPSFVFWAAKLTQNADIVHLFLPQFDAPFAAIIAKILGKPVTITYACDLRLPTGLFNRMVNLVINSMNHLAAFCADRIVALTEDYANASPFLIRYRKKTSFILPPVQCVKVSPEEEKSFHGEHRLRDCFPVIGMVARLATEKGVEILVDALPRILRRYPTTRVLYAGQYHELRGEEEYAEKLMPSIQPYLEKGIWSFLGLLPDEQLSALFGSIDVVVVPSLNSTESYGMVQIEAMMHGTSVVASDLPGVRQPVLITGQGRIIPVGDSQALAEAICALASEPKRLGSVHKYAAEFHNPDFIAAQYETLFGFLFKERVSVGDSK